MALFSGVKDQNLNIFRGGEYVRLSGLFTIIALHSKFQKLLPDLNKICTQLGSTAFALAWLHFNVCLTVRIRAVWFDDLIIQDRNFRTKKIKKVFEERKNTKEEKMRYSKLADTFCWRASSSCWRILTASILAAIKLNSVSLSLRSYSSSLLTLRSAYGIRIQEGKLSANTASEK